MGVDLDRSRSVSYLPAYGREWIAGAGQGRHDARRHDPRPCPCRRMDGAFEAAECLAGQMVSYTAAGNGSGGKGHIHGYDRGPLATSEVSRRCDQSIDFRGFTSWTL